MLNADQHHTPLCGGFSVVYSTAQGKPYPLELGFAIVPIGQVPVDVRVTTEACKKGCRLYGRNGGCPPFSPEFHKIPGEELLVLYAKLLTRHFPPRVLGGPYYSRWVFVETFMTPLMNRIGRLLAPSLGGYFLSSGNCHSCRPKRCAVKDGLPCRKPDTRTFSLESVGVIVTEMMKGVFGLDLQWWQRGNPTHIPAYMAKVVGFKGEDFARKACVPDAIANALAQSRVSIHGYNSLTSPCFLPFLESFTRFPGLLSKE